MDSQVSCHEVSNLPEHVLIKDVITSETHHVTSNQPAKKQTRQWAAWTREEEESFFNALRQFGKNFEKITSRVQSKNKDQVRHYYYRLVRRMNKLLGPELSLDAKNSKDTNSAMLRWWSLLQKHSCKASKLHLKPRRFKIFLETLEHQLLKDRKKNTTKKRPFHGENCLDQNNCNGNLSHVKQARHRRRSCITSTTGDKKREKAAVHLEQTTLYKHLHFTPPVPPFHQTTLPENITHQTSTKLKLQLFPINENVRKALEADNHNPHLELTLSFRKKISSVLEHMNRKWGSSSIASGELTLVPYHGQNLNLTASEKWTQGSVLTTGDVYAAVGCPSVFRLRYGWFVAPPPPRGSHNTSSVFEWADSLTNISISELLLVDGSVNVNSNCNNVPEMPPGTHCAPFSCDSFDAAIAAHISKNLENNNAVPVQSSLLDAEETCDAFTFFKKSHTCKEITKQDSTIQKVAEADEVDGSVKDAHALTDLYWPESLGPLEVELTPCRYQSNELLLSESLNGLSRILSGSLDAFQNCSFFGC